MTGLLAGCLGDDDENGDDDGNGDDANGDDENGDDNGNGEPEAASFDVDDLSPGDITVPADEMVDVSATIANVGDEDGEQDIELRVDGDATDVQTVSLDGGDEETVEFDVDTSEHGSGEIEYGVYSDDDDETATIELIDASEWEDVESIRVEGTRGGWDGMEPEMIEGETNATLVLFEGQEYEFTWENGDGDSHNVELWDQNEEIVDDYATELTNDDEQTLEFTASSEMTYYRCLPHAQMQGNIFVVSE
ncbi:hypothetical protein OB905_13900 [Halobacteria archaeon AArc-dxtr1]|nr:hypothetical protein [Halobacteria archaeon AArc-dxtr1]